MSREQGQLVVFFLGVIAAVMLFGREMVMSNIQTLFWIGAILGILALIFWMIFAVVRGTFREFKKDRDSGKPWMAQWSMLSMVGLNGIVVLLAWLMPGSYKTNLDAIPLYWLPIVLMFASIPWLWIEDWRYKRRLHKETGVYPVSRGALEIAVLEARQEREPEKEKPEEFDKPIGWNLAKALRKTPPERKEPRFD